MTHLLEFDTFPPDSELFTFSPTTVDELSNVIHSIASKSCVLDPLPAKLFIPLMDDLLPVICKIVNLSLKSGYMPPALKKAVLLPTLKKPILDYQEFANFRPISYLKMVSKVIEKVVSSRLIGYLHENNLQELFQSAYKRYHSCETALLRVLNDILRALDSHNCVVLLLLDLSSAFDTVDHEMLIHRLRSRFGIKEKALDWLRSHLANRSHFVNIGGVKSETHNMTCGVPQGSVLGPILYLLYTSPLADILRRHNMLFHFYADDTQLYTSFTCNDEHDLSYTVQRIEDYLADIRAWMLLNKLKLNEDKTELLVIHSRYRQSPVFSLNCGHDIIIPSDMARNIIGVIFDKNMTVLDLAFCNCFWRYWNLAQFSVIQEFQSFTKTKEEPFECVNTNFVFR